MPGQPLRDQDLVLDPRLVKLYSGPGELPFGLDEVAGVGPEAGVVFGDNYISFTGVAGDPGDLVPAGR